MLKKKSVCSYKKKLLGNNDLINKTATGKVNFIKKD